MMKIIELAQGHPLALSLITGLARNMSEQQLLRTLFSFRF
jgi:hypothetical protein